MPVRFLTENAIASWQSCQDLRHSFLYQIQEHQEVVNAATEAGLSWTG